MGLWVFGLIGLVGFLKGQGFLHTLVITLDIEFQSPGSSVILLALFWGLGVGTIATAWLWHRRGLRSLTGKGSTTLHHFLLASTLAFAAIGGLSLITLPFSEPPSLNMDPLTWALFLPLGLTVVAGQTFSEEILFRGYLQSQLAGRFKNPLIWMAVPSVLFGFGHYVPSFPTSAALVYVMIAIFFGLIAADLTARTGSIGAAWGFHFANNTMAILFVVSEGSLTGLGLFKTDDTLSDQIALSPLILIDIAILFGVYLLIRRFTAR
ncbi:MAG: CPBP family intramembrane metalloprotease [Silicimonas sp.]|nr:CPBP family intramembrane metalloprotease [Silicimonas sp.]